MAIKEELTCEEKIEQEKCDAAEAAECLQDGDVNQLNLHFWAPPTAQDTGDYTKMAVERLLCRENCFPTNGKEIACAGNCEGVCDCCTGEAVCTGCPDPDECPSRTVGYGYVELVSAAEHAGSLEYIPFKIRDLPKGTRKIDQQVLIFDPLLAPDNQPCDPCKPTIGGAWTNVALIDLVRDCLTELGVEING